MKYLGGVENVGEEEVEEGPQFVQVVLQGSPRQQEPVLRRQLAQDSRQLQVC